MVSFFLRFWEVQEGLERSGRLIGTKLLSFSSQSTLMVLSMTNKQKSEWLINSRLLLFEHKVSNSNLRTRTRSRLFVYTYLESQYESKCQQIQSPASKSIDACYCAGEKRKAIAVIGVTVGFFIHGRHAPIFGQYFDRIFHQIFDQDFWPGFWGQNVQCTVLLGRRNIVYSITGTEKCSFTVRPGRRTTGKKNMYSPTTEIRTY